MSYPITTCTTPPLRDPYLFCCVCRFSWSSDSTQTEQWLWCSWWHRCRGRRSGYGAAGSHSPQGSPTHTAVKKMANTQRKRYTHGQSILEYQTKSREWKCGFELNMSYDHVLTTFKSNHIHSACHSEFIKGISRTKGKWLHNLGWVYYLSDRTQQQKWEYAVSIHPGSAVNGSWRRDRDRSAGLWTVEGVLLRGKFHSQPSELLSTAQSQDCLQ